tara:strand:- start:369 stop:818 length:450 start_codon:yes stop_codon:yes gene_type:complete
MILGQILAAWIYSHFFEYIAHKHFLHNHKHFKFAFKNHFSAHHKNSRKNNMHDKAYEDIFSSKFEVLSLLTSIILHLPIVFYFPFAYFTLFYSAVMYYLLHKKAHTDIDWGKTWMPWHYDHHMGKNQNVNWGVRLPIFDYLFKTRVKSF